MLISSKVSSENQIKKGRETAEAKLEKEKKNGKLKLTAIIHACPSKKGTLLIHQVLTRWEMSFMNLQLRNKVCCQRKNQKNDIKSKKKIKKQEGLSQNSEHSIEQLRVSPE